MGIIMKINNSSPNELGKYHQKDNPQNRIDNTNSPTSNTSVSNQTEDKKTILQTRIIDDVKNTPSVDNKKMSILIQKLLKGELGIDQVRLSKNILLQDLKYDYDSNH